MMKLAILLLILRLAGLGQIHEDASGRGVHGAIFSSTGSTANTSGTPIKIGGTFSLSGFERSFDEPVEGRLRYTGERTRDISFVLNFSFTSSANNIDISLFSAKNGVVIPGSEIKTRIGTGADVGLLVTSFVGFLAKDDFLEAFLDTSSGNPTITTQRLTVVVVSMD